MYFYHSAVMASLLLILSISSVSTVALAAPIYKSVDDSGRVVYSSQAKQGAAEAKDLPAIGRWKPRAKAVADSTCQKHGGVACDKGAQTNGAVVCLDGYTGAVSRFSEACKLAKLEALTPPQRQIQNTALLKVSVRNNSAALAQRVLVSFIVNKFDPPLLFAGPDKIEPFSIADYVVQTTTEEVPNFRMLALADVTLKCGNCR